MHKYLFFYQGENKLDQIKILRLFIISTIIIFCYQYLLIDPLAIKMGVGGMDIGFSNSDNLTIISALLLAPILEELFSRGFLTGKRNHFWFFFLQPLIGAFMFKEFSWFFLGTGLLFLVVLLWEQHRDPEQNYISRSLFYFSFLFAALFFTLLHYENIESQSLEITLAFTFAAILPAALLFGWIRFQGGLRYSMTAHALFNLITITLNELLYL